MSAHCRRWGSIGMLFVSLLASGCSTQARWVNCEGRLEPINRPATKIKESSQEVASPYEGATAR
jgi:hypothetical protein